MNRAFKKRTALVTGAGKKSGIGYAIARKLAAGGANIIVADLGDQIKDGGIVKTGTTVEMREIATELKTQFKVDTMIASVDVTDTPSIQRMAGQVQEHFTHIDILCNNAGASFGVPNTFHTYDEDAWMKTVDVNLHSVFRVTRAMLPLMKGRKACIVNTASRAGKVPPLFNGAYAVAKAGVIMLTKVMAMELAGEGIRVNAVCPGQIMTELEKWRFGLEAEFFNTSVEERKKEMCKTIPLNRIGTPEEVAKLVAFLASDESSYCTGQALNITGGQLMEL
jgi:NAD(P)-dependent dehydrogenase (short-subunit alcohol dehydrogenase family)